MRSDEVKKVVPSLAMSTKMSPGAPGQAGLINILVASMTSPSQAFSRNQREYRVLQAIEQLADEHRDVLRMRYVEGLPSKEIAAQIGKSDAAELAGNLASLFEQLDVREYLAKYVPGKESIMALTDHMFTPGRADNNLRQASEDDVRALLDEAIDPLRL